MVDHPHPVDAARVAVADARARGVGDAEARALGWLPGVLAGPLGAGIPGALVAADEGR